MGNFQNCLLGPLLGSDAYAPLNLPENVRIVSDVSTDARTATISEFEVYRTDLEAGKQKLVKATQLSEKRQPALIEPGALTKPSKEVVLLIWDTVWWRRIVYFASLAITLTLLTVPFLPSAYLDLLVRLVSSPLLMVFAPIIWVLPKYLNPFSFHDFFNTIAVAIGAAAAAILPSVARPWIEALQSQPFLFCLLVADTIAVLYLGSLLDRRIHDRALAAWNAQWRTMRHFWFVESNKTRLAAVIGGIGLLSFYVVAFVTRYRDGTVRQADRTHREADSRIHFRAEGDGRDRR